MKRTFLCCFLWLTTLSLWAQYNPSNPPEPGQYYTLTLQVTPTGGGSYNLSTITTQQGGNFVRLRATAASNFSFAAWAENGVILSQDAQFDYQMPDRNVTLTAHFDYTPSNPGEPYVPSIPVYSRVYATCDPSEGGSFSGVTSGNSYQQGSSLSLRTSAYSNFQFDYWTEEGEVISTSASFNYVVKTYDTHLVAHFSYNPSNPSEPPVLQPTHILYISANPSAGGSFSPSSGSSYQPGTAVSLKATAKSGYTFSHWAENDSIIATTASATYTMPNHDVALQAHFTENAYNPANPAEPGAPTGERHNIFGMTENALQGETIQYPIWIENTTSVMNMYIDLTFPLGFEVDTAGCRLSERCGNHWLEKIPLENNTWRMRVRGQDVLVGKNGSVFTVPVTVPQDALMAHNYLVALTHGVVMRPDSTQVPIGVRSGNIYVKKLLEDGLYASFSYDKYQTRVGFKNRSAGNIQTVLWDFGDGQQSTEYSPLHVYEAPGTYTVKLTIQGAVEEDIMETTIVLNDPIAWKVEGSFYMDSTMVSARNFSSIEELVTTLLRAEVTGNAVVNILAGTSHAYSLSDDQLSSLLSLLGKIKQAGKRFIFRQQGIGSAPVISLGTSEQHSLDHATQLLDACDVTSWQGVETHLYGMWFDLEEMNTLKRQVVSVGEKSKPIDFTRIAPALSYTWVQTPKTEWVNGAIESGNRLLPSMFLTNQGEGSNEVKYQITASRNGNPFAQLTHTIVLAPALVGLFNGLSPADGALMDATAVTISWNRILNAQYDLYLWDNVNTAATMPVLHASDALQFSTSGFCRYGHSYNWVVVASNGSQRIVSDTMSFSIRQLPDLHIAELNCSQAQAEGKIIVSWSVRNDGKGETGNQQWKDRVWLVMDVYPGTALTEFRPSLLTEVDNVKALAVGEGYSQSMELSLPFGIYGDAYILVTTDMYNVADIEWSSIGGAVINPYEPSISGSGYRYLYAKTNATYNQVYEEDETSTYSDNFFYRQIHLNMPPVPDLQISKVIAEPLSLSEYRKSNGALDATAEYTPTPLTFAGLADANQWYSGKQVKVSATIVNRGTKAIEQRSWRNGVWRSASKDRDNAQMFLMATQTTKQSTLAPGDSVDADFYVTLPYEWSGNTFFHVMADVDDVVDELANTPNNWWQTDTIVVNRTPGADFLPSNVQVPDLLVSDQNFELKYQVQNIGQGIPYVSNWKDKVWLSSSPEGLNNSAILLATIYRSGSFSKKEDNYPQGYRPKAEDYIYTGDNYSVSQNIKPGNIPSGKYYVYVQVDADNVVDETEEGEGNNIIRSDSVRFIEPDLIVTDFSVSQDTVTTGDVIALTWTIQNIGAANIQNAQLVDALYATINQDGSGAYQVATLQNSITIPAGERKTLRANVSIPKDQRLDGLRYIYLQANSRNSIRESNKANNRSSLLKTFCIYTEEERQPEVYGPALGISDVNMPQQVVVDSTATIIFRLTNVGDRQILTDVTKEVYISSFREFSPSNATPLDVISVVGSTDSLRAQSYVMVTMKVRIPSNLQGGDKYLHVICDRTNAIKAKSTQYNRVSRSVFLQGLQPDICIGNVVVHDTIFTSQSDTMHFEIRNNGTYTSSAFNAYVYITKRPEYSYSKDNIQLKSIPVKSLATDEQVLFQVPFSLEDKQQGKWYIHIIPDLTKMECLSDSAKSYAKGIVVTLSPVPDLEVKTLEVSSPLITGEQIEITYTVENIADEKTRQSRWADDYWLSPSTKLDPTNAIKLGGRTHMGVLQPHQMYESNVQYTIPANVQGNYMLYVRTDAAEAIVETDEDNNMKAIPIYIQGDNDRPADLMMSNISVPSIIYAGEPLSITYTIINQGEFEASGNLRDIFYLSSDDKWDTADNMVGVASEEIKLAPGESITRTATGRISHAIVGTYYLIIRTNSSRSFSETNYENNTIVSLSPVQLDYHSLQLGTSENINATSLFKLDIPEGQGGSSVVVRLSAPEDHEIGLYVSYNDAPSSSRSGWHASKLQANTQEVVLSNVQAGTYYVLGQSSSGEMGQDDYVFSLSGDIHPSEGPSMTLSAEQVNFGATSLSNNEGGNGGWVTTNINGALFDSVMDFRLLKDDTTLPAEVVTWNGGTQSSVTFNLNDAAEGSYDLVSELPNGLSNTLEGAFQVVEGRSFGLGLKLDFPTLLRPGTPYFPFTFSYANGGTTDIEISEIRLVIDNGVVGLSIEELLNNPQQTLIYKPHSETNARGYVSIPPGEQEIVNIYCTPFDGTNITVSVFIYK